MKGNKKALAWKIVIYIFLVLMAFLYLAPLVWMFFVSLKTNTEIFKSPFALPEEIQLGNFIFAWTAGKLGIATLNSAIVCVTALILNIIIGCMASFALGRLRFKMSGAVMTYFLIGMMIPIHCILIPLFKTFSNMHLYNSLLGLIIPYTVVSLPTTIFIMTGFFKNMPNEMFEAACIDGCSIYKIFALSKFVGPYNTNYTQMFAAIIIAILPTIIVYCCFSNQIVDGLTAGAVKG